MTAETTHNRVSAMVSSMVRDKNEQDCVVRCEMGPFKVFLGVRDSGAIDERGEKVPFRGGFHP